MSTYKNLIGKDVNFLTTDPDNAQAEGQIWYNSTAGVFKDLIVGEAFSSAAPIGTARYTFGVAGTQTAGLLFAGDTLPGPSALTEEYNGSGWANGGNMSTARRSVGGFGIQTAAVVTGGNPGPSVTTATEEYDGSSWTGGGALGTGRRNIGTAGILTAGLAIGGNTPGGHLTNVEHYNGTSWTAGGAFPSAVSASAGAGTQTAALSIGGSPGQRTINFKYDGSSWTALNSLNTGRGNTQSGGDSALAVVMGGYAPSVTTATETWDGTNWTTSSATLATAKTQMGGGPVGSSTASFGAGGYTAPGITATTEEWNRSINVITGGAFSSMSNLNTARWGLGGAGTKSAAIVFGGRNPPVGQDLALSEQYNGTSWSEGPDLNTATRVCGRGTGTSTAALKHGGHSGSPSSPNKTAEEYNGSSWANGGASTNNHDGTMQIGTQTAAASCGSNPPTGAKTEEYNGTSFSTSNDMPYSGYYGSASGSQTAGVVFGGYPNQNNSAEYDGTNWTAGNTLLQPTAAQGGNGGSGTQTLAIGAGGYTPGPVYLTAAFTYDGTNFATAPSMSTARQEVAAQGANDSFYVAGGITQSTGAQNLTEEFTPESSALNIKTITTG